MAGSLGCGPLLGKPVIKQAFPLFEQCAGLISSFRISVRHTEEGGSQYRLRLRACFVHSVQAEVSSRYSIFMWSSPTFFLLYFFPAL